MAILVDPYRNNLAGTRVTEFFFVMKAQYARLVIDFNDKLLDEVAADDSIKVMSKPGEPSSGIARATDC